MFFFNFLGPGPAEDGDADGGDEPLRALLHVLGVLKKTSESRNDWENLENFLEVYFDTGFDGDLGAIDGFLQKSVEGVQGVLIHMLHLKGELQKKYNWYQANIIPMQQMFICCIYVAMLCIVLFFLHSHVHIGCAFCALQPLKAFRALRAGAVANSTTKKKSIEPHFNEDRGAASSRSNAKWSIAQYSNHGVFMSLIDSFGFFYFLFYDEYCIATYFRSNLGPIHRQFN